MLVAGGRSRKRNAERASKDRSRDNVVVDRHEAGVVEPRLVPGKDWHPAARYFFDSLRESALAPRFEQTDWAVAFLAALALQQELDVKFLGISQREGAQFGYAPIPAATLNQVLRVAGKLGMTEGDRLAMGIELSAPREEREELAAVVSLVHRDEDRAFGA